MDADARRILELLGPAVERAERVEVQQEALLQRQEASAQELASQIADMTQAAEDERARLLQARSEFDALREAEVARQEATLVRQAEAATAASTDAAAAGFDPFPPPATAPPASAAATGKTDWTAPPPPLADDDL